MAMSEKHTIVDVLIRTKELLEIPGAWIKHTIFMKDGESIGIPRTRWSKESLTANAPNANQYCLYGALHKAKVELGVAVSDHSEGDRYLDGAAAALKGCPSRTLLAATVNNNSDLAMVQKIVCKAITLALDEELVI